MTATAAHTARVSRLAGYLFALAAGAIWGTTGPLSTALYRAGEAITGIGFWRLVIGLVGFLVYGLFRPQVFKIDRKALLLVGLGGGALVALFEVAYQFGIAGTGVAGAAALLYIAPVLVAILAQPLLGEPLTTLRIVLAFVVAAVVVSLLRSVVRRAIDAFEIVSSENRAAVHARAHQLVNALALLAYGVAAIASVSFALARLGIAETRWEPRLLARWFGVHGLNAGIIDRPQFTILIGAVIGSAVIPTVIAQWWFAPPVHALTTTEVEAIEDEEFEPAPRHVR